MFVSHIPNPHWLKLRWHSALGLSFIDSNKKGYICCCHGDGVCQHQDRIIPTVSHCSRENLRSVFLLLLLLLFSFDCNAKTTSGALEPVLRISSSHDSGPKKKNATWLSYRSVFLSLWHRLQFIHLLILPNCVVCKLNVDIKHVKKIYIHIYDMQLYAENCLFSPLVYILIIIRCFLLCLSSSVSLAVNIWSITSCSVSLPHV